MINKKFHLLKITNLNLSLICKEFEPSIWAYFYEGRDVLIKMYFGSKTPEIMGCACQIYATQQNQKEYDREKGRRSFGGYSEKANKCRCASSQNTLLKQ